MVEFLKQWWRNVVMFKSIIGFDGQSLFYLENLEFLRVPVVYLQSKVPFV